MALPNFVLRGLEEPTGILAGVWAWIFNKNNRPENEAVVQALELQGDECVLDLGFEKPCHPVLGQAPVLRRSGSGGV